jgi:hypothetical protein
MDCYARFTGDTAPLIAELRPIGEISGVYPLETELLSRRTASLGTGSDNSAIFQELGIAALRLRKCDRGRPTADIEPGTNDEDAHAV